MANGTKGDSPLGDMLIHGLHPFPADMEAMLREVLSADPKFPDSQRHYVDQVRWMKRFDAWAKGKDLDEGRQALKQVLTEIRRRGSTPS